METNIIEIPHTLRIYKDRIRIFLILYTFAEKNESYPSKRVFKSEVRLQKLDFLLRNPDYFAYQLLLLAKSNSDLLLEIKDIVFYIFYNNEPEFKKLEMERFFFGAYENIDDIISFLMSINFINYSSKRSLDMKEIEKIYTITDTAEEKMNQNFSQDSAIKWYLDRCSLIKKYFGNLNGTQLKNYQYEIEVYKNTLYGEYIQSIQDDVKTLYKEMYGDNL